MLIIVTAIISIALIIIIPSLNKENKKNHYFEVSSLYLLTHQNNYNYAIGKENSEETIHAHPNHVHEPISINSKLTDDGLVMEPIFADEKIRNKINKQRKLQGEEEMPDYIPFIIGYRKQFFIWVAGTQNIGLAPVHDRR